MCNNTSTLIIHLCKIFKLWQACEVHKSDPLFFLFNSISDNVSSLDMDSSIDFARSTESRMDWHNADFPIF